MEDQPVVEALAGELGEVLDRLRRLVGKELDLDRSFAGVERGFGHAGTVDDAAARRAASSALRRRSGARRARDRRAGAAPGRAGSPRRGGRTPTRTRRGRRSARAAKRSHAYSQLRESAACSGASRSPSSDADEQHERHDARVVRPGRADRVEHALVQEQRPENDDEPPPTPPSRSPFRARRAGSGGGRARARRRSASRACSPARRGCRRGRRAASRRDRRRMRSASSCACWRRRRAPRGPARPRPRRAASPRRASSESSSGRNLLKTGSSTTGATKLSRSTSERRRRPRRRPARPTGRACARRRARRAPAPVSTEPIATALSRSSAKSRHALAREAERALVQEPEPDRERQAHERREARSGRPSRNAPSASGSGSTIPSKRLSGRREREHGEERQPERDVGEDRAVARIVIAAGQLLAARSCAPASPQRVYHSAGASVWKATEHEGQGEQAGHGVHRKARIIALRLGVVQTRSCRWTQHDRATSCSTESPDLGSPGSSRDCAENAGFRCGIDSPAVTEAASTKADDVALELEQAIVSGEFAPGTVLRQEQLRRGTASAARPSASARRVAALGLLSFEPNRA